MNQTTTWQPVKWSHSGLKNFETWKAIPEYEGFYEVSSLGQVRSVDRVHWVNGRWGPVLRKRSGSPVKPYVDARGYANVHLCKNGKARWFRVARVVLIAFIRPPAPGEEAGHGDDDPTNNSAANLTWVTREENEKQKTERGRRPESTVGKLRRQDANVIRDMRRSGFKLQEIAALYQCHFTNVGYICQQKTWRQ